MQYAIWNKKNTAAHNYYSDLKIAMTNIIYGGRKGIGEHAIEGYAAILKLFDVNHFIKLGGESAVFKLSDGNILKLSINKYNKYLPEFHAPEIMRGEIETPKQYKIFNLLKEICTNKFYFLVQKPGKMQVTEEKKQALINKVLKAGYDVCDIKYNQFADFEINGQTETRFVDLGCIVPYGQGGW